MDVVRQGDAGGMVRARELRMSFLETLEETLEDLREDVHLTKTHTRPQSSACNHSGLPWPSKAALPNSPVREHPKPKQQAA